MNGPFLQTTKVSGAPDGEAGVIDVGALLGALWRAKFSIGLAGLLAGVAAYALVSRVEPTYRAMSQVMLDPRQQVMINDQQNLMPQLTLSNSVVASEVAVLQSNLLAERVVRELDLASSPEFNPDLASPSAIDTARDWVKAQLASFGLLDMEPPVELDPAAAADIRYAAIVRQLQTHLEIAPAGISYVISIVASSKDPELAARIANTTADDYLAQQIDQRTAATNQATEWLDKRVTDLRTQVETAEAAISQFKSKNLVLEGSTQEAASQQLLHLATQVSEARARSAAASARFEQADAQSKGGDLAAVASTADSPVIATLRTQRADLQQQIRQQSELYGGNDQRVSRARAELADLDAQILTESGNYIDGLRNTAEIARVELKNLEDNLLSLESRILDLSKSDIELRQLEREAAAVRDVYEALLSRLKETRAIEQINVAEAKVVSDASIPAIPAAPRPGLLGALGAVLGFAGASGLVLARELGRRIYRSPGELEAATGLPVLAELPRLPRLPEQGLAQLMANPQSGFAERLRDLRAAVDLRSGGKSHKVVMLTSARAGDGKSRVVLALARIASLAGRKVIVVDANLRRPSFRSIVHANPEADLASILLGGCDWRHAVVRAESAGFDILPTARPDTRAADALAMPAFSRLIEALRAEYDLVLIDTPPVVAISDARTIAAEADMTLLVVRLDHNRTEAIQQALTNLGHGSRGDLYKTRPPKIGGFVLTGRKHAR